VQGIQRISYTQAMQAATTRVYDFIAGYVNDLGAVIDMDLLRSSQIAMGVDPLGGAGVHYWSAMAEKYGLNLTIVRDTVDPTFRFMSVDWDGQIRMDPSSPYAMHQLIGLKDKFTVAFACDTDHDRHGIVTQSAGLLPTNHYLTAAIWYLFQHRPAWSSKAAVAKTVVSSQTIDRVAKLLKRSLYEVPVGFKWFVDGLLEGTIGFCGEESAGATFLRRDGRVWTTDKDGMIAALLAGEMTARLGKDPGEIYQELTPVIGNPVYDRVDAHATPQQKERLKKLSPDQIQSTELAGERIVRCLTKAPGNGEPLGGLKVETEKGWFAARPSGTEEIYKIYAESFKGEAHLKEILKEAQALVDSALHAST
jgi:phosphoglucomutase